jgi:hypothetical protein
MNRVAQCCKCCVYSITWVRTQLIKSTQLCKTSSHFLLANMSHVGKRARSGGILLEPRPPVSFATWMRSINETWRTSFFQTTCNHLSRCVPLWCSSISASLMGRASAKFAAARFACRRERPRVAKLSCGLAQRSATSTWITM